MDLVGISLISAAIAVFGVSGGWALGHLAGRRAAITAESELLSKFGALQASMGNVASQCSEYMERANVAVQRVSSERSNIARRTKRDDEPVVMSEADYLSHLNKGGGALPEVERALGLMP